MIDFMRTMFSMPKHWLVWLGLLIAVNMAGSLYFIGTLEGKVVLAAVMAGMMIMMAIYKAKGFVRLLGVGHIFWAPMLPWLWFRLDPVSSDGLFEYWVLSVIILNGISLVIDAVDVIRYMRGERAPYLATGV